MKRSPTMKDVAKAAGVSVMTVSRAFKRDTSVGEMTRKRIQQTAEDLGYVFDSTAANLRSQRSNFVAVTIPSLNNANFAATVEAMTTELAMGGYQVLLGHSDYNMQREEELIAAFLPRRPEAIVVTGGRHTDRTRKMLKGAGVPVIETWDLPEDPIDHVVGFSNVTVLQPLIELLIAQGLRNFGFIGGDTDSDSRGVDRRDGFKATMQAHQLESHRLIGSGVPQYPMQEGARAMGALIDTYPEMEAVICVSDLQAFGALSECQRRGIGVPDQIAIAGFGAYDIAEVCVPSLTTIDPHPADIGRQTAQLVRSLLQTAQTRTVHRIEPAVRLGQSTNS